MANPKSITDVLQLIAVVKDDALYTLRAALADDAKYPQLKLPDMQRVRIQSAIKDLEKL